MDTNEKNNYRWFVCTENKPMKWSCIETSAERALGNEKQADHKRTMAIPVSNMMPTILDKWYVKRSIKNHLNVSVKH